MSEKRDCVLRRVSVVGACASGKTTLAATMAGILATQHVELDCLAWASGWHPVAPHTLRARVATALRGESWIADGNCDDARDLIWSRATSIIWLNYPQPVVVFRAFQRSLRRFITRSTAPTGDTETMRHILASPHSAVLRAITRHRSRCRELSVAVRRASEQGLSCFQLLAPADATRLLRRLPSCAAEGCSEVARCAVFM